MQKPNNGAPLTAIFEGILAGMVSQARVQGKTLKRESEPVTAEEVAKLAEGVMLLQAKFVQRAQIIAKKLQASMAPELVAEAEQLQELRIEVVNAVRSLAAKKAWLTRSKSVSKVG